MVGLEHSPKRQKSGSEVIQNVCVTVEIKKKSIPGWMPTFRKKQVPNSLTQNLQRIVAVAQLLR